MVSIFQLGSLIEEGKRHAQQYERLQSIYKEQQLVQNLSSTQAAQIRQQRDFELEQIGLDQAGVAERIRVAGLNVATLKAQGLEELQAADDLFGTNMGALKARAAANNIDISAGFQAAEADLVSKFQRQQNIRSRNVRLRVEQAKAQETLLKLDSQKLSSRAENVDAMADLAIGTLSAQTQLKNLALDTQARIIEIDQLYSRRTGEVDTLNRLFKDLGIGTDILPKIFK